MFWANCAKYSKNWLPYALHHNPLLIIDPSWILTRAEFSEKTPWKQKNGLPKYTSHGLQWLVYGIYSNSIKFVAVFPIFNSKSYIEVELNIGSFFFTFMLESFTFYLLSFGHTVLHDFAGWRAVYVHVQSRKNRGGHCVFKWILCGHLKPTPSATI